MLGPGMNRKGFPLMVHPYGLCEQCRPYGSIILRRSETVFESVRHLKARKRQWRPGNFSETPFRRL
jgi:hypothetical protein